MHEQQHGVNWFGLGDPARPDSCPAQLLRERRPLGIEDARYMPISVAMESGQHAAKASAGDEREKGIGHERDPGCERDRESNT
jgi:hypothetical protein